uniref:Uncharacterized protein n=1 Tax=Arundo donax TaxID=35708 RepID=A0A0A9HVR7_ARUDO
MEDMLLGEGTSSSCFSESHDCALSSSIVGIRCWHTRIQETGSCNMHIMVNSVVGLLICKWHWPFVSSSELTSVKFIMSMRCPSVC